MIGVIVTGHGNFATGLTSSVKLIAGSPENYVPVDFTQDKSTDDLERELREAIDLLKASCSGILIFTDLVGGSPFKVSAELSVELKDSVPIAVLSGTNLGMLVEGRTGRRRRNLNHQKRHPASEMIFCGGCLFLCMHDTCMQDILLF